MNQRKSAKLYGVEVTNERGRLGTKVLKNFREETKNKVSFEPLQLGAWTAVIPGGRIRRTCSEKEKQGAIFRDERPQPVRALTYQTVIVRAPPNARTAGHNKTTCPPLLREAFEQNHRRLPRSQDFSESTTAQNNRARVPILRSIYACFRHSILCSSHLRLIVASVYALPFSSPCCRPAPAVVASIAPRKDARGGTSGGGTAGGGDRGLYRRVAGECQRRRRTLPLLQLRIAQRRNDAVVRRCGENGRIVRRCRLQDGNPLDRRGPGSTRELFDWGTGRGFRSAGGWGTLFVFGRGGGTRMGECSYEMKRAPRARQA